MGTFAKQNFKLANGCVLPLLEIAYETYGEMSADRSNVILVTHGITSSHVGTGPPTTDRRRGWYAEIIGPGKLFDTDRFCVVSSNTLGSCYGSTGPASRDPRTGRSYGSNFPEICYEDIVRAQHALLRSLGVERLLAVAGSSIGGFQAFQWAVTFPDFISAVLALDTATRDTFDISSTVEDLLASFASDANWNGGDYVPGSMVEALTKQRIATLRCYGFEEKAGISDEKEMQRVLYETAREWAEEFDPHCLLALFRAWGRFNVEDRLSDIKAPIMYVLCDTDAWFPASLGAEVVSQLRSAGVDLHYHEVHSDLGHYATAEEPEKWVPEARAFFETAFSGLKL